MDGVVLFLLTAAVLQEQRRQARLVELTKKVNRWARITPEERARRMRVWKHNSFHGHVAMAKQNMNTILQSPTVSYDAKQTAYEIEALLVKLSGQLKERVDGPQD